MPVPEYRRSFSKSTENIIWTYYSDSTWKCSTDNKLKKYETDFLTFFNNSIANGWKIDYGESL